MIATTHLYSAPTDAYVYMTSDAVMQTMDSVRRFSFEHGILGQGASSVDAIGIQFPNGKLLGNPRNIKMRIDASFTKQLLDGTL